MDTNSDAPKPAAIKPVAPQPDTLALIETWFVDSFHREPIATNTVHFNYVRAAVNALKQRLSAAS